MYLNPVSTAIVTMTASGPNCSPSRRAPTTFAPLEMPAKIPSSAASRRVIAIASASSICSRASTFDASQCGGTNPVQPWMRNVPRLPPEIAAEPAGSSPLMNTPRGRNASATPMSDDAVPIPWQNAVTRPPDCSQISRPRWSRCPGTMYGLLNWSVAYQPGRVASSAARSTMLWMSWAVTRGRPATEGTTSTVAPRARINAKRSSVKQSAMTMVHRYPFAAHTNANAGPVDPPVYSTTVAPGSSNPSRSAPSIIANAIRSFIEPVGFRYSSFIQISAPLEGTQRLRRTIGVLPI
jgi:hypothetical protein